MLPGSEQKSAAVVRADLAEWRALDGSLAEAFPKVYRRIDCSDRTAGQVCAEVCALIRKARG